MARAIKGEQGDLQKQRLWPERRLSRDCHCHPPDGQPRPLLQAQGTWEKQQQEATRSPAMKTVRAS